MVSEAAFPSGEFMPKREQNKGSESSEAAGETTPGRDKEVRWEVVALAQGQADAAIICGRLETEGIPARIQQEPAGAVLGLTMGLLGQVKVLVPEPLVAQALEILNGPDQEVDDEAGEEEESEP
jgi:hypothetical protein